MNIKEFICGVENCFDFDESIVEYRERQLQAEELFLNKLALLVDTAIQKQSFYQKL